MFWRFGAQGQFKFAKGEPSTFTRDDDFGNHGEHIFCENCGISLGGFTEVEDMYSVAATTLQDAAELSPKMLIYTAHAPGWATFSEGGTKV